MGESNHLQSKSFIRTSFRDVTVGELLSIEQHTPRKVITALSSLTTRQVNILSSDEVLILYELVSFIDDLNEVGAVLPLDFTAPKIDVAGSTFEKCERAKIKASEKKAPYRLFLDLVEIYFPDQYLTGLAAPALAIGALIYEDLCILLDRFKDLASEKPTEEEEEAGVSALHTFGSYGICESIASRYSVRPYEVFSWSAEEVYLELTYQMAKSRYQDNLRAIEKRKSLGSKG
jgi:hypothetical protein